MTIYFTKMQALANDFILIDAINQLVQLTSEQIIHLANRHTGIGFDQCLIVEPSKNPQIDFSCRIFNADGKEVGQCGNGMRCLARFVTYYGLTKKSVIVVATSTTQLELSIHTDSMVSVKLPPPNFTPPNTLEAGKLCDDGSHQITLADNSKHNVYTVNIGNPHAIYLVQSVDAIDVNGLGKAISEHDVFPQHTNVGFMQILNHTHILLRVYERGCGETKACGSGAVAAAIVAKVHYNLAENITVILPGGTLNVQWRGTTAPVLLHGPAHFVYEGKLFKDFGDNIIV